MRGYADPTRERKRFHPDPFLLVRAQGSTRNLASQTKLNGLLSQASTLGFILLNMALLCFLNS